LLIVVVLVTNYYFDFLFILKSILSHKTNSCVVGAADREAGGEVAAAGGGGTIKMLGARRDLLAQLGYRPLLLPKLRRKVPLLCGEPFVSICQTLASAFEIIMEFTLSSSAYLVNSIVFFYSSSCSSFNTFFLESSSFNSAFTFFRFLLTLVSSRRAARNVTERRNKH
jgi:hypothetical protein